MPGLDRIPGGFACVALRRLKPHRYELAPLTAGLANIYRTLLQSGGCTIRVNGDEVRPLELPVSNVFDPVEIRAKLSGRVTVRGKIWVTDRERLPAGRGVSIRAGIRSIFNGRLITDGEQFGHYLAGRGSLQRLLGEIEIGHLLPNTTKGDWDRDSEGWALVEALMHAEMLPVITYLRQLADAQPVTREQRKRAERVRRRIESALRRLARLGGPFSGGLEGDTDDPGGRRPSSGANGDAAQSSAHATRGAVTQRTPPSKDAVGRLLRRYKGGVPPFDFDALGRGPRSQIRDSEKGQTLVINTDFPMYENIGYTEDYLLETAVLQLLDQEQDPLTYEDARARLDEIVWASVAEQD